MGGTVTTDASFFTGATGGNSSCDSTTDWTGSPAPAVDTVQFVQGTGSLYSYLAASSTSRTWTFSCQSTDIRSKVIYFWFALGKVAWLNTKASGGLKFRVYDSSGAWGEWYVAGRDTLPHNGFICHAIHADTAFDATSGTVNKAAVTKFDVIATGSFPGKAYLWLDAVRIGSYIQIKGGTSSDPATLEDIITAESDVNNMWGIFSKVEGIYFCQGKLLIGSTTSGQATYFKDINKVLQFKSAKVPEGFYEIKLQGNSGASTYVYFGEKSGTRGINGCFISAPSTLKWKLSVDDTNVTGFGFYGCSLSNLTSVVGQAYSTSKEFVDTTFTSSGEVLPDTGIINGCFFVTSPGRALRMSSTSHHITNSQFIACQTGIHIPNAGEYTFDALKFSGNTYDVENSSSGTVIINCVNGSNPSSVLNSGGGTTEIRNVVYINVYVKDPQGNAIPNARVAVYKSADMTQLMNELTDSNGLAQETFQYPGTDVPVIIRVRKSSPGTTRYVPVDTSGVIGVAGLTQYVTLTPDTTLG